MIKSWTDEAWEEFEYWMAQDKKTLRRILQLLKDIDRNGYEGIGKRRLVRLLEPEDRRREPACLSHRVGRGENCTVRISLSGSLSGNGGPKAAVFIYRIGFWFSFWFNRLFRHQEHPVLFLRQNLTQSKIAVQNFDKSVFILGQFVNIL